jgi:hypothetical protein
LAEQSVRCSGQKENRYQPIEAHLVFSLVYKILYYREQS